MSHEKLYLNPILCITAKQAGHTCNPIRDAVKARMHKPDFSKVVHAQLGYHITGAEIEQDTPQDRAVPEFWVR